MIGAKDKMRDKEFYLITALCILLGVAMILWAMGI
jgi:hypothetical protein